MAASAQGLRTVALGLLLLLATTAGADDQYRVAGLILSPSKQLAVIEKSDGTQALYRQGDRLENYLVELVDQEGVFLLEGGRRIFLELEGRPTLLADVSAIRATSDLQVTESGHATKGIDAREARAALQRIQFGPARPASRAGSTAQGRSSASGGAGSAGSPASTGRERQTTVSEEINLAIGLPSYASIRKINNIDIDQPSHAKLLLETAMIDGRTVRLELGGSVAGVDVIYLTPNGEEIRVDNSGG